LLTLPRTAFDRRPQLKNSGGFDVIHAPGGDGIALECECDAQVQSLP
jgi:hypothetical protein